MSRLRMLQVSMATMIVSTGLAFVSSMVASATQTFTGKVSDAMCGAKHTEVEIAPVDCVRACVQKGAKYALVVGEKCIPSARRTKPRWIHSTSWLGSRPKSRAPPAEIPFQ